MGLAGVSARLPSPLFHIFLNIDAADGVDLEKCFDELVMRLMREGRDLCRVELLAWFDHALRRHRRRYKLLYRQFRELLPHALGACEIRRRVGDRLQRQTGRLASQC